MTQVVLLRGLFEDPRNPNNMLSHLTRHLDPKRFSWSEFPVWGAGFGDYDRELDRVSTALAQHIRDHQGPLVGAGFSGGSHVWKRAMLLLDGPDRAKLLRLVLCADPSESDFVYPQDRTWGSRRARANGIAGDEPLWTAGGVDRVTDAGDPICFTPDGSPLHRLAAVLTARKPAPGSLPAMQAKLARVTATERQDYSWPAYVEAGRLLNGYAVGGAHTRFYPTLLAKVAEDINREVLLK